MDKSKIALIGTSAALLVALLLSLRSCSGWKKEAEEAGDYIASVKDTIAYLKDSAIAQKKAIIVNENLFASILKEREDLAKYLKEAKIKLSNVQSIGTVTSHSTISKGKDSIQIKYEKIPCPEFEPVPFDVDSSDYTIAGKIYADHLSITHLDFPDTLSFIVFTDRHLFRKNETKVSAQHSNKYIRTTGLENLVIREEKKWWDRRAYYIVAGILGGYLLFR